MSDASSDASHEREQARLLDDLILRGMGSDTSGSDSDAGMSSAVSSVGDCAMSIVQLNGQYDNDPPQEEVRSPQSASLRSNVDPIMDHDGYTTDDGSEPSTAGLTACPAADSLQSLVLSIYWSIL